MQLMWEGLPGNVTVRTESFIVTKNGCIQTAYFFLIEKCLERDRVRLWGSGWTRNQHCVKINQQVTTFESKRGERVSPGGVHASIDDWTSTDRLFDGMGIFLSLYLAKAAWTASVCRSETEQCGLAYSKYQSIWHLNVFLAFIFHHYQIWSVHPGCWQPGTCCV